MAEQISHGHESAADVDQHDDVLGKIDQLLNRHRPRTTVSGAIPVLAEDSPKKAAPIDDGIPVLNDVVGSSRRPATLAPSPTSSSTIASVLILRRMAIALDAEHIRLLAQIDRSDAEQARMLGRLVAELKRALPGAVRAALAQTTTVAPQPDDARQL